MDEQRRPDGPHDLVAGRHDDFGFQLFRQRPDDALVESHPALEHHRRPDVLAGTDVAEVVARQRPAQAVNNIIDGVAHLLLVHHVRLREDGAAPRDAHLIAAGQRPPRKLLDAHAETGRLVVEKAARTGGADGIHAEVRHHAVADNNQFAVLPADLDDGA